MQIFDSIDTELVVTATAVIVAGMAAILGIWMERDSKKPARYAWSLSALILLATAVSLMQSVLDKAEQDEIKEDMARLLATMDKIASESNDPALLELVNDEIKSQSRDNPDVVEKVAERVVADGRDAEAMLGKHLDAADAEKASRKANIKPRPDKPKETDDDAETKLAREGKPEARREVDPEVARAAAAQAAAARGRGLPPGAIPPGVAAPAATTTPTPTAAVIPVPTPTPGAPGAEAVGAPPTTTAAPAGARTRPGARTPTRGGKPGTAKKPAPRKPAPRGR